MQQRAPLPTGRAHGGNIIQSQEEEPRRLHRHTHPQGQKPKCQPDTILGQRGVWASPLLPPFQADHRWGTSPSPALPPGASFLLTAATFQAYHWLCFPALEGGQGEAALNVPIAGCPCGSPCTARWDRKDPISRGGGRLHLCCVLLEKMGFCRKFPPTHTPKASK